MGINAVLNEFHEARSESDIFGIVADTFFRIAKVDDQSVSMVKPQVRAWIEKLHEQAKCTDYIHDVLVAVPKERLAAIDLFVMLVEMNRQCQDDDEYCRAEKPRDDTKPSLSGDAEDERHHPQNKALGIIMNFLHLKKTHRADL